MIVKPTVSWLTTDNDAELINDTNVVLAALAKNISTYAKPSPTLAVVQSALDDFSGAVDAAAGGGVALTAAKNKARAALVALLRQLASYVQVTCAGDMESLLLSGFPVQKPERQPIGVLPAPASLVLTLGARSGELDAKAAPVFGAAIYNWRLTATGQTAPAQTVQTTAASTTFAGLTPAISYSVQVNAVGAAGPSDWSNQVTQIVV